ncbi:MAG: tetratricopeptide repeat protein [Proteobacteria bacterium]|nr:tetratricopeptide repeat protein [Pseudomonadota bacterium]
MRRHHLFVQIVLILIIVLSQVCISPADTKEDALDIYRKWLQCIAQKGEDHEDCQKIFQEFLSIAYIRLEELRGEYSKKCSDPEKADTEFCKNLEKKIKELEDAIGEVTKRKDNTKKRDQSVKLALEKKWEQVYAELLSIDAKHRQLQDELLLGHASLDRKEWIQAWCCFDILDKSKQKDKLLKWAENLCKTNPDNAVVLLFKGDALARLGKYDDSISALDRAVELDPKLAIGYDLRGLVRIGLAEFPQAADDLARVQENLPNALYERGILDVLTGDFEGAITRLTNLLNNEPRFFLARNARGVAYLLQAKYDLAFEDFDQVAREYPEFICARTNKTFGVDMRAKGLFVVEDIGRLAEIIPKGLLGSLTMVIADEKGLQSATKIAAASVDHSLITSDLNRAISLAKAGDNVIYQHTVPSISELPQLQPIIRNLDRFNETVGLFYKLANTPMPNEMKVPLAFSGAIIADIKNAQSGQFGLFTSHTLERVGEFGLKELPGIVNVLKEQGKLPSNYNLSPILAGLPDITAGAASQMGRRSTLPSIEEVTHYLDGINKAAWATVGALVGGPRGSSIASTASGLAADIGRGVTLPIFEYAANNPVRKQMVQDYLLHVEAAMGHGVPAKTFSDMFGPTLISKVGFDSKRVADLDDYGIWANNSREKVDMPFPTRAVPGARSFDSGMNINRSGVFLKLGDAAMDVKVEKNADLSFLQGDKKIQRTNGTSIESEPVLKYPFLIFNQPTAIVTSIQGKEK